MEQALNQCHFAYKNKLPLQLWSHQGIRMLVIVQLELLKNRIFHLYLIGTTIRNLNYIHCDIFEQVRYATRCHALIVFYCIIHYILHSKLPSVDDCCIYLLLFYSSFRDSNNKCTDFGVLRVIISNLRPIQIEIIFLITITLYTKKQFKLYFVLT